MNNYYMSAEDIKILIPTMSIKNCRKLINDIREEMKANNYFVPTGKTKLALTKLVKEKLGI